MTYGCRSDMSAGTWRDSGEICTSSLLFFSSFIYWFSDLLPLGGSIEYQLYHLPSELDTTLTFNMSVYKASCQIVSIIYAVVLTQFSQNVQLLASATEWLFTFIVPDGSTLITEWSFIFSIYSFSLLPSSAYLRCLTSPERLMCFNWSFFFFTHLSRCLSF